MFKMTEKLTILMTPTDAIGHLNASLGIAEQLRDRGHKVVFAVHENWKNKLTPQGFIEEWLDNTSNDDDTGMEAKKLDAWGEIMSKLGPAYQMTPEEQIKNLVWVLIKESIKQTKENDPKYKKIVEKIKPDIIVSDLLAHQPAVMDAGIPWILSISFQPLWISSKNVPPVFSGYPTGLEHKKTWETYRKLYDSVLQDLFDDFKEWVIENGGPELKFDQIFLKFSSYANIYMYPEELDYTKFRPNPPNFYQFDTFIRKCNETFEIPEFLKNKPGKLIYFSMGTLGCTETELMNRLISIFSKFPYRFIISKGPMDDKIKLGNNMWGASSVPQIKVLPLVDLVICHGGNNTVTESLYFGKPMIILPLFDDQLDNAQRVMETGFGIRLHPYKVTEQELLTAIETLLCDDDDILAEKLSKISKRIQASNSLSRVADLIENVAYKCKVLC